MTDSTSEKPPKTAREERDRFNAKVKELILEAKKRLEHIKEINMLVEPLQKKENILNATPVTLQKELKELKIENKKIRKKIDSLSSSLKNAYPKKDSFNPQELLKEVKKLDWIVQTEVLSAKKEDELSRKVIALEKKLKESKHYTDIKGNLDSLHDKIDDIKYKSQLYTDLITDTLDRKYKNQNEIYKYMRIIKKERIHLNKINKEINSTKKFANITHKKLLEEMKIKKIKQKEFHKEKMKRETAKKELHEKAVDASYDNLLEQLKNKKKITL